jgi:hypothetical protein
MGALDATYCPWPCTGAWRLCCDTCSTSSSADRSLAGRRCHGGTHQGAVVPGSRLHRDQLWCARRRSYLVHAGHQQRGPGLQRRWWGAGGQPATGSARTFLTGAIRLRGNVNLFIAPGATLRFNADANQYLPLVQTSFEGSDCYNYCPLIYAPWRTNVAITGAGTLDGGASNQSWWPWSGRPEYGWTAEMPNQFPDSRNLRNQNAAHVPINQRSYGSGYYLRPPLVQMFSQHECASAGFYCCERSILDAASAVLP